MLTLTITNPNTVDPNPGTDNSYTGTNPVSYWRPDFNELVSLVSQRNRN